MQYCVLPSYANRQLCLTYITRRSGESGEWSSTRFAPHDGIEVWRDSRVLPSVLVALQEERKNTWRVGRPCILPHKSCGRISFRASRPWDSSVHHDVPAETGNKGGLFAMLRQLLPAETAVRASSDLTIRRQPGTNYNPQARGC